LTIFGSPGGTTLNTSGFQGTSPGNAVGATLPGIPPNMSVMAAISAGLLPINALLTNYGQKHHPTQGRTLMDALVDVDVGVSAAFVQNGGSMHSEANGGTGPGAGQQSQIQGVGAGCTDQLPANAPANLTGSGFFLSGGVTVSGGTPPTFSSPVNYGG
jgi:hypothetical protein